MHGQAPVKCQLGSPFALVQSLQVEEDCERMDGAPIHLLLLAEFTLY
jgi:hypothetical protein